MALVSLRQLLALKQCPLSARIGLNALEQLGWRAKLCPFRCHLWPSTTKLPVFH